MSDTGRGIAPATLPHVFDRFWQADSSTTREHGGLGLGLALSRQTVLDHGGDIWVDSTPGGGACFYLRLPASRPVSAPA